MTASYKPFFSILVVLLAIFCGQAMAADSAYTVDRIKVDVTADNAAEAREQAFNKAQVKAFGILAGRLLSSGERAGFEMPPPDTISSLIQDYEILDEQLSQVRYVGTYRFRFRERAVGDFFSNKGVAHTDDSSKPVLVIPFYQRGSRNLLWSDNNPWLSAWRRNSSRRGLVPVVVPIGDLEDITEISEEKALASDWSKADQMRRRYGAGEIIVLLAVPAWNQNGQITGLRVDFYTLEDSHPGYASNINIERKTGERRQELFNRATREVKERLQQIWKDMTIVDPRQTNEIMVRVRFGNVGEWVATKSALDGIKMLDELKVQSLTSSEAFLNIKFRGDESRLRLALSQKDLTLSKPQIRFKQNGWSGRRQLSPLIYDLKMEDSGYRQRSRN